MHAVAKECYRVGTPVSEPLDDPASERYRDDRGQIKMCCGCRRTRRWALGEETWECVPHFVETMPPDVTHGICPSCLKHYYPDEG
jgi:hypothetical protein